MSDLTSFLDGEAPHAPARTRIGAGAALGSVFLVFMPVLLLLWWSAGPEYVSKDGLRLRVDLLSLLYPIGAVVTGALFFLLAGLVRTRFGKALMGAVSFLPWIIGIALCINGGYNHWTSLHSALTLIGSVTFGATLGWHASQFTTRRRHSQSIRDAV